MPLHPASPAVNTVVLFSAPQQHQMGDAGNALFLHEGGGAHQRAGGDTQHLAQLAAFELGQDMACLLYASRCV